MSDAEALFDFAVALVRRDRRRLTDPVSAQDELIEAAALALRYFDNETRGTGRNSMYDPILIGRSLHDALARIRTEREAGRVASPAKE